MAVELLEADFHLVQVNILRKISKYTNLKLYFLQVALLVALAVMLRDRAAHLVVVEA